MTGYPFKDRLAYIRSLFAPETAAAQNAAAGLHDQNNRISIYPEEGKLLQMLIKLAGVKTIVEIGTLGGYSALWMAAALPPDGKLMTIEKDDNRHALAQKHLAGTGNVTLLKGDALDVLKTIDETVDMVFIDADKLNYLKYLDWAETHVRKGGLIIGDNTLLFDAVWHDDPVERVRPTARQAMRDFNERLADPARYHSVMLPTAEGLTIGIKLF